MSEPKPIKATPAAQGRRPDLILIDDDDLIVGSLSFVLREDFQVHSASSRARAKAVLQKLERMPELALVDLGLPPDPHQPGEGFALISELLAFNPGMKILVLSGQNGRSNIQHALTLGAVDFIPKPCDPSLLKARLQHQLMILDAERSNVAALAPDERPLGASPAVDTLRALIHQFADTPFAVLIEGESGSGKELVAQQLHERSSRASQPFLTINCAAFTPELLETQLFGHAKGAYTGAGCAKAGFFEEAGAGSLLLDEVGELPLGLQAKLLRVLENGEYYRLGETQPRKAEARIIAATNRDLREAVRSGKFRSDLYHRLSVLTIHVPPLRERGDDCLLLLNHFQAQYAATVPPFRLEPEAEELLRGYGFPGNIRELRNVVIRLGAKYPGRTVGVRELAQELESEAPGESEADDVGLAAAAEQQLRAPDFHLDRTLAAWERRYINAALRLANGNLSQAARLLGVNRTTLYSRIQRLSPGED